MNSLDNDTEWSWKVNRRWTLFFAISHLAGGWFFAGMQTLWLGRKTDYTRDTLKRFASNGMKLSTVYTIAILLVGVKIIRDVKKVGRN